MKILISCFDPFGNSPSNSSSEVVNSFNNKENHQLFKVVLPTVFNECGDILFEKIRKIKPDVVIMTGQAEGREKVTIERVAINFMDATIPDNKGYTPTDKIISNRGENAYFSTFPLKNIVNRLKHENIPASISNTAGTFVCNNLFYNIMEKTDKLSDKPKAIGFVHFPLTREIKEALNKENTPFMERETLIKSLSLIIDEIIAFLEQ